MFHRGDKTALGPQLFVPDAVQAAVSGRDENLVDRRVETDPRVARRDSSGIAREVQWHFWILKITHPVRHAKVKQVEDRRDTEALDFPHRLVGKGPIVLIGAQMNSMI